MKLVTIFTGTLYAVLYDTAIENELERLMQMWTDVSYLREFAKLNAILNIKLFVQQVSEDAEDIQDFVEEVGEGKETLDQFFRPLYNGEMGFRRLSLQKAKPNRKSFLRLYAIRIDAETYLITGGGIKIVATIQESQELMKELQKMKRVKNYLIDNGVFDKDSFQDLKTEQDEDQ